MTAGVAPSQAAAGERPATVADLGAWLGVVLALLTYSQAWLVPVFGDSIDPDASGIVRAAYIPAYAIGLILIGMRPADALRGLVRQPFLLLLMAIVAISMLWSVSPDQTLRRTFAVMLTTLGGVAIGTRWRWRGLAETLGATFAILAVGSLFVCLFIPSVGRMTILFPGAWRGLWLEKNAFGGQMAFAALLFAACGVLAPSRRWMWFALGALAVALILASTSKTSLVGLVLGLAVFGLCLVARRGGPLAVVATYTAVVAILALGAAIAFAPEFFLGLLGKDATLTGRTKIWAAVMRRIQERPWTGYGYGAVWSEEGPWGPLAWIVRDAGFKPEHSHNSWLEQWLGLGYFGLGAWALYYLSTIGRAIWAMFRSDGGLVTLPFLVVYSLITLTESVAVSYNDARWVIFVAFAVRLAFPPSPVEEPAAV